MRARHARQVIAIALCGSLLSWALPVPKEIAEHLMLIDLGRNDIGRVCEIGSVEVTERFTIERYSHVKYESLVRWI